MNIILCITSSISGRQWPLTADASNHLLPRKCSSLFLSQSQTQNYVGNYIENHMWRATSQFESRSHLCSFPSGFSFSHLFPIFISNDCFETVKFIKIFKRENCILSDGLFRIYTSFTRYENTRSGWERMLHAFFSCRTKIK